MFLSYPTVSQTVFQGFACTQLDVHEYWLTSDLQTACSESGTSPLIVPVVLFSPGLLLLANGGSR